MRLSFPHLGISRLARAVAVAGVLFSGSSMAQESGAITLSSEDRQEAIKAIQGTLPSVAILGQKAGPSDTIEVFIQVPGVLNMQSVYVLSDRTSVISGVVIPPIVGSYPGGQLELPDGNASIDPRAKRSNMQAMNDVLGIDQSHANRTPQPASSDTGSQNIPSPRAPTEAATPSPAASSNTQGQVIGGQATAPTGGAAVLAPSHQMPASGQQVTASPATAELPSVGQQPTDEPQSDSLASQDYRERVISSLSDVSNSGAFGAAVRVMLDKDSDIKELREIGDDPQRQQSVFLDVVKSLPAIVQGDSEYKIYVMFDPNCSVCHRYYTQVAADVRSGSLEIHWIPSIVFPDNRSSLTASAALIADLDRGGDALGMLDSLMTDPGYAQRLDSSEGIDKLVPYLDPVVKNTALMTIAHPATPLVIFEHKDSGLTISPGIPKPGYVSLIKAARS